MPQFVPQTCVRLHSPYQRHVELVSLNPLSESILLFLISLVTVCGGLFTYFAICGIVQPRLRPSLIPVLSIMVICAMSFLLPLIRRSRADTVSASEPKGIVY